MGYILNIETATTNCSVSISKEGKVLFLKEDNNLQYSHAESLHVFINEVMKQAKVLPSQLNAIAVSKGPGSYTGLRIGVSAVKGLCFALDKPLISVDTLQSLSHQVDVKDGVIVPMLDARRMEVYSAIFDADHHKIRNTEAQILGDASFNSYLELGKVYFIGNGTLKAKTIITHPNAHFIDDKLPSAREMGSLSYEKYKKNNIEDIAYFEPYYLKEFIGLKS